MVHFSMFFRYMEESEHALWRAAGLNIWASGENLSWPRISASFDYKAPLRFQDEFEVQSEMESATRRTIKWRHILKRAGVVVGAGSITTVCVTKNADGTISATEIPPAILTQLRSALPD